MTVHAIHHIMTRADHHVSVPRNWSHTAGSGGSAPPPPPPRPRGQPWEPPPGAGVFLGGVPADRSFNVNAQTPSNAWEAAAKVSAVSAVSTGPGSDYYSGLGDPNGLVGAGAGGPGGDDGPVGDAGAGGAGLAGEDPWEGSEFKRQMLVALANKLLLKVRRCRLNLSTPR
jgi:hypothetical protein